MEIGESSPPRPSAVHDGAGAIGAPKSGSFSGKSPHHASFGSNEDELYTGSKRVRLGEGNDGDSIREFIDSFNDNRSDDESMSGYSAASGRRYEAEPPNYRARLIRFYQKYNCQKLSRVEEFLAAYRGEEEQLFRILSDKYGPEPEINERESAYSASEAGGFVPISVSPGDGLTESPTPYWPECNSVQDTDLLELLETHQSSNGLLARYYLGVLVDHPAAAFNGMTYITSKPLPRPPTPQRESPSTTPRGLPSPRPALQRFLGHLWCGTLENNKVLFFHGTAYNRCIMHCSESCNQDGTPHERWRLTMYRSERDGAQILYRVMWDPVGLVSRAPKGPEPHTNGSAKKSRGFSFSWGRSKAEKEKAPPPPPPPQPRVVQYTQPQQPQAVSVTDTILTHLRSLEKRVTQRFDALEERIFRLENIVAARADGAQ